MMRPLEVRTRLLQEDVSGVLEQGDSFLSGALQESGQKCFVLGLSGGIDSAVAALWAARAVGVDRLILVSLPYGLRSKGRFPPSSESSVSDADVLGDFLGRQGATYIRSDIAQAVDAEAEAIGLAGDSADEVIALGNLKARVRAVRLRTLSNIHKGLVLGTENRTENLLGYFTRGGDEESDVEILTCFYKTEVRILAAKLEVPESIQCKAPSADLWPGQEDERELGFAYEIADPVLAQLDVGDDEDPDIPAAVRKQVLEQVRRTQFKRSPKPSFRPQALTNNE